jgi:pyrroline-5-carboxylate reductase
MTVPFLIMNYSLSIIGAGNMAEAIVRGILSSKLLSASRIIAADVSPDRRGLFASLGVKAVENAEEIAGLADTALLSVKPQQMGDLLPKLGTRAEASTLFVSIAAGKSTPWIEKTLGGSNAWRVVRAMPNTPMMINSGVVGISAGKNATDADLKLASGLFKAAADVVELPENLLDAVTAISGSGPAYFYLLVEQMVQAGVEMGLTAQQATLLATRTALGSAKLLMASADSPAELRRKVTSPGGTTLAAISHMEKTDVLKFLREAFHKACERSKELAG